MSKIKLAGTESTLPTQAGLATSFNRAPGIRLVANGATATVTVLESLGGEEIGTFTILANTTEHLAKANEHVVYATGTVLGTPVGFVG